MRNLAYIPSLFARLRPDDRHSPRYGLNLGCFISSSQIGRRPARIKDLSLHGCRIETPFSFARDQRLVVTIEKLSPRGGTICWSSSSELGIHFAAPLHQSVVDQLVKLGGATAAGSC